MMATEPGRGETGLARQVSFARDLINRDGALRGDVAVLATAVDVLATLLERTLDDLLAEFGREELSSVGRDADRIDLLFQAIEAALGEAPNGRSTER